MNTKAVKIERLSPGDPVDFRKVFDQAIRQQWECRETQLKKHGGFVVKHAARATSGELIETEWFRLTTQSFSTIDVHTLDGTTLKELQNATTGLVPVAVYGTLATGRELEGLHVLSPKPDHLVLGQYALPETIELVYEYQNEPPRHFVQSQHIQVVSPEAKYL